MKNLIFTILLLLMSKTVFADSCGAGRVIEILEGGWNTDDLMIKIDYSGGASLHAGTEYYGFIVFKNTLNSQRFNGIKSIALSALMTGKSVKPYSHNNNCSAATQISLIN